MNNRTIKESAMNHHRKKMIAPIVITVIISVYFALYFGIIIFIVPFLWLKWILGIFPALFGAVMIGVCIQRIKEIKGGEEDDLSQY